VIINALMGNPIKIKINAYISIKHKIAQTLAISDISTIFNVISKIHIGE
jgi:Fe2+ transport system protein FeoA